MQSVTSTPGRCTQPKRHQGFTLLEMLLVLLIMGMVAGLSVTFIDNEDNQLRYEESLQKLNHLREAVLSERHYQGQILASGFVVDNGRLPPAGQELTALIKKDGSWDTNGTQSWDDYAAITPRYRIVTTDSYTEVTGLTLLKGYRGPYLNTGLDSLQQFKDGWGDDFIASTTNNDLTIEFKTTGKPAPYNAVNTIDRKINEYDWSVPLSVINAITVKNKTSFDLDLILALVVFKNDTVTDDEKWTTYFADLQSIAAMSTETIPNLTWKNADAANIGDSSDAGTERIPVGKHALILVEDANHTTIKASQTYLIVPHYSLPEIFMTVN